MKRLRVTVVAMVVAALMLGAGAVPSRAAGIIDTSFVAASGTTSFSPRCDDLKASALTLGPSPALATLDLHKFECYGNGNLVFSLDDHEGNTASGYLFRISTPPLTYIGSVDTGTGAYAPAVGRLRATIVLTVQPLVVRDFLLNSPVSGPMVGTLKVG